MPLLHIPSLSPVLVASVKLCAIWSLNLVFSFEARTFPPVLHKDSHLLRPTHLPGWRLTKLLSTHAIVACLLPH